MLKATKKIIASVIIANVLFTGYAIPQAKPGKEEDFYKVLSKINESRRQDDKREVKFSEKYTNWIKDEDKELSEKDFNAIVQSYIYGNDPKSPKYDAAKILTIDEAKEDINTLFNLFRYNYGPYGYLGGDEVFYKVKENILKEVDGKTSISTGELSDILWKNLYFCANDGHFFVNKNPADKTYYRNTKIYYFYDKFDFFKDEKGYHKIVNNEPYYIESIDGNKDVEKFMKLTINDEGKLVYAIAKIDGLVVDGDLRHELVINVKYSYGNNKVLGEKIILNELNRFSPSKNKEGDGYKFSLDNGIPTFNLRRLSTISKEDTSQEDFAKSASQFKEYPVNILDIRETMGGSWSSVAEWIRNYVGHDLQTKEIYMNVNTKVLKKVCEIGYGFDNGLKGLFYTQKSEEAIRGKNDNLIFMLIHKRNGSSSDLSIRYLKQLDNLVLVGSNSAGVTLALDVFYYKLKNSNIDVNLGQGLSLTGDGDSFELKGYEPDILVDSDKAEEKVKKLINYYKLNVPKTK